MAVLLQYNRSTSFTIRQLHDNTQIGVTDLQQVLRTLIRIRLLFCDYNGTAADQQRATLRCFHLSSSVL